MPIYEYKCSKCGKGLEVFQSFSDKPLTVCPKCKGRLKKIINPASVIFKGSGFYVTDSRSANSTVKSGDGEGGRAEEIKRPDAETTPDTSGASSLGAASKAPKKRNVG